MNWCRILFILTNYTLFSMILRLSEKGVTTNKKRVYG